MAVNTILGSDSVKNALVTKCNDSFETLETSITALTAGSGVPVSANDASAGYLNGKLVAGTGITLTEGNDGGDETLTVASDGESIIAQCIFLSS